MILELHLQLTHKTGFPCLGRLLIFPDNTWDEMPTWSQDGQHIAFVPDRNGSFDMYTTGLEGEDVTRVRTPHGDVLYPDWSSNGNSIVFCLGDGTNMQIYNVNVNGSELEQLTSSTSASCFPVWR